MQNEAQTGGPNLTDQKETTIRKNRKKHVKKIASKTK